MEVHRSDKDLGSALEQKGGNSRPMGEQDLVCCVGLFWSEVE